MSEPGAIDWTDELLGQLTWHWETRLRPRLVGLTDEEYLWEPVAGAWNLRPRGQAVTSMAAGGGDLVIDFEHPEPSPPPVTTIAWRIGHLLVGVFGDRNAARFHWPPVDYLTRVWPATADEALAQLEVEYQRWVTGVRTLDAAALAAPCGSAEGDWSDFPLVGLVLHVHREAIHHGAEIALLRDLYAHR
jgi:hypothetical protein